MNKKSIFLKTNLLLAILIPTVFLFSVKSYPYADEWNYAASVNFYGFELWKWIFSQHVDHYIPIQKFIHHYLLIWGGFDLKILVLLNILTAYGAFLSTAGIIMAYRKKEILSDFWLALYIFLPSSAYFQWGFQFQFISSVTFFLIANYFYQSFVLTKKQYQLSFALLFLILTSSCGMNGFVLAMASIAITTILIIYSGKNYFYINWMNRVIISLLAFIFLIVLINWSPSGASEMRTGIIEIFSIYYLLHAAPFSILGFDNTEIYAASILAASIFSLLILGRNLSKSKSAAADIFIFASLLAGELLLMVIAYGRAGSQSGWSNGLILHYGPLTMPIIILSWIVLTKNLSRKFTYSLSIIISIVSLSSYHEAYNWRAEVIDGSISKQLKVEKTLTEIINITEIVDKFALEFTWRDDEQNKSYVLQGLNELLNKNFSRYKRDSLYEVLDLNEDSSRLVTVNQKDIISQSRFDGSDFYRSNLNSFLINGSYINSDSDTGSITLKIRRGDMLLYRSGPTFGNQLLKFANFNGSGRDIVFKLPVSLDWRVLNFSNSKLPDEFIINIVDDGQQWGEWSSIGVKDE